MFELYKMRYRRHRLRKHYKKELAKLYKKNATSEEIEELEHNRYEELRDAEEEIATFLSDELVITAHELDARLPASDDNSFWAKSDPFTSYLNTTGRDLIRTRIKEVKDRNFDDRARWFKFFMPLIIALLTGIFSIAGTVIGFWIGHKK